MYPWCIYPWFHDACIHDVSILTHPMPWQIQTQNKSQVGQSTTLPQLSLKITITWSKYNSSNINSWEKITQWRTLRTGKTFWPCIHFYPGMCLKRHKRFVVKEMIGCEEFHFARMMTRKNWFAIGCGSGVKTCNPDMSADKYKRRAAKEKDVAHKLIILSDQRWKKHNK